MISYHSININTSSHIQGDRDHVFHEFLVLCQHLYFYNDKNINLVLVSIQIQLLQFHVDSKNSILQYSKLYHKF